MSYQVVLGFGHIGIIWAQPALIDLQGTTVIIFHLLVLALILAKQGQVVQLLGHIWVIFPQDLIEIKKQMFCGNISVCVSASLPLASFVYFLFFCTSCCFHICLLQALRRSNKRLADQ